jgi:hypothetical protein
MAKVTSAILERVLSAAVKGAQHKDTKAWLTDGSNSVTMDITMENGDIYQVKVSGRPS